MRVGAMASFVGLLVLVVCAPARAGVVSTRNAITYADKGGKAHVTSLSYAARPGEANDVRIDVGPGELTFTDLAGVQPGRGCVTATATEVRCDIGGFSGGSLKLGDGNDRLAAVIGLTFVSIVADGGAGDDVLYGSDLEGREGEPAAGPRARRRAPAAAARLWRLRQGR